VSIGTKRRADRIIDEARRGVPERLGQLLESYRNYLRLLAATQIDGRLQAKISASDLVQETMLNAYRDFAQFRGHNERQLLEWLRQILINRLHVFVQHYVLAEKRNVRREVSLEQIGAALDRSTANLKADLFLADDGPSPGSDVIRRENAVVLADQLARMSPSYREVIVLRNLRGLSFDEVALKMDRTSGAVRMLWLRAIRQLREQMQNQEEDAGI
jgi:RNA polymerase sigma-70 factor (ECF subfamily)